MLDLSDTTLQMAWFIINDTYRTDLILLYPPYIIALAAIYITVVLQPNPSLQTMKSLPASAKFLRPGANDSGPFARTRRQSFNSPPQPANQIASARKDGMNISTPPPVPAKVVPLDFFARFPISMSLVLELVQEIVSSYEIWNRLENPTLSIHPTSEDPADIPTGLASTRLNQPIYAPDCKSQNETPQTAVVMNAQPSHDPSTAFKATGDKAADERVVEILVRMRKAREFNQH